jgi:carboxypeptidase family protein
MKPVCTCLLLILLLTHTWAQSLSNPVKPASRAAIEGMVTKEPGGEPVKKAVIELIAENQVEGGDYTAVTGAEGTFRIEGIAPGRYRLFAERTGFLEVDKHRTRSEGRVLTLASGQDVKDLQIRMQAAAVVRGRVTDEDGEALANAQVTVMRQTFASGRAHWEQTGSEHTNDLGEFRIGSLPPGNYYVSVSPPPDFRSLIEEAGRAASDSGAASAGAPDKPAALSYQTTYYPGTSDRSQVAPIQLRAGDEFPVNVSLTPSPSLSIRGSVVNLPPHSSASIILQSRDFGLVLNGAEMHKDGSFVIRDVVPGAYTILATVENAPAPMTARQSLLVAANSIEGLRLAPQPGGWIRGRLRLISKGNIGRFDSSQLFLVLRPADGDGDALGAFSMGDDGFSDVAPVAADGSFEWKRVPAGNYYVDFASEGGPNAGWFLKSVAVDGRDSAGGDISVNGGVVTVDLVASANGGLVEGVATDRKGEPVANAVIVAVPDPRLRKRVDRYRKTLSDQNGRFILNGIPPGAYTLLAWESVDGEAYYNADFLKNYEGQGTALQLGEGERKSVQIEAIPAPEDLP